jgi:hypothetical protein
MGLALSRIPRTVAVGFLAVFIMFPLIRSVKHDGEYETPYSQIAAALPDEAGDRVAVVHLSPMSYYPVIHYRKESGSIQRVLCNKAPLEGRLRIILASGLMAESDTIDIASLPRYKAIWVISDPIDQDARVRELSAHLENTTGFSLESERQFCGVRLSHFVARAH